MLTAVVWLALLEIWTATRLSLSLDVDVVGVSALTENLVEGTHRGEADVYILAQRRRVRGSSIEKPSASSRVGGVGVSH